MKLQQAVVIGAGIGGLSTAIALRQMGLAVTVYEQASRFGEVGAGITLWANAIKALAKLGISEADLGGACIAQAEVLDARGRVINRVTAQQLNLGAPNVAVHRADLHQVLLAALPAGCVHTGAVCTGFTQNGE